MGIPLVTGRALAATDGSDSVPVAVINRNMARRFILSTDYVDVFLFPLA